ncbi:NUDIX hydrolase [Amycolatopsis sp. Hca4]|uniref:NUDIX domain-containing protein n=1 Tax=Amycolatopsis sp. Hca4 TaxID=2742131 RepID=UPI00158FD8D4|nr:NUDIX hydrolase [Amycolatopsis sp. Hca4]QKV74093.1 NUDIX hydrolase [Amycolatopsis sp. Hca4]
MVGGAGLIIRDARDRVLLVHTTYGDQEWELPGGGLEPGEWPSDGAVREVREEIGVEARAGRLLANDLVPYTLPDGQPALLTNWLFDGGVIDPVRIRPDHVEIDEARFCDREEYPQLLPEHMARRVDQCFEALRTGRALCLHQGHLP